MPIVTIITVIAFSGALFAIIPCGGILQKLLIVVLALTVIVMKKQITILRQGLVLVWPLIAYLVIVTLSAFAHSGSIVYTLAAIHPLLVGLIIYIWAINLRIGIDNLRAIKWLIYAIVLIQFVFVMIKFYVHGIDEKLLIGTMSNAAGQLGFLFPAIVIPLLIFMMNSKNNLTTCSLVAAMFLFGIINEKRAAVIILPVILLVSIAVNLSGAAYSFRRFWGNMFIGGLISILGVFLGLYAVPSLNPEEVFGGSISQQHISKYTLEYLTMDFGGPLQGSYIAAVNNINIQVGRVPLWTSIFEWLRSVDTRTLLFGTGFGMATPSIWLQKESDFLFGIIGTRGAISAGGLALVETGLVGFLTIGYFFIHIFWKLVTAHRQVRSIMARRWFRSLMIVHFVFCFDFFFYSTVLLQTLPMPFIFFGLLASITLVKCRDTELFLSETSMQVNT